MRLHWRNDYCCSSRLPVLFATTLLLLLLPRLAYGDIGVIAFWVPDLYALLGQIQLDGNPIEAHVFSGRRFYVTRFKGHNIVALNSGEGMANSAAATAILLQKFPAVDRIVGTGIAGGVVRSDAPGNECADCDWNLILYLNFPTESITSSRRCGRSGEMGSLPRKSFCPSSGRWYSSPRPLGEPNPHG